MKKSEKELAVFNDKEKNSETFESQQYENKEQSCEQ